MPFGIDKLEFSDIDHIVGTSSDPNLKAHVAIEVTDIPLLPDLPKYPARLVLMNGQIFKRKGDYIPGAVWDQPLEKIRKDHEARKRAAQGTKATKGTPGGSAGSLHESKAPSSDSSSSTKDDPRVVVALGVAGGILVAVVLWKRYQRAG